MSRIGWILTGAVLAIVILFLVANAQRTTSRDAGEEIKEAAESTADYVQDTGRDIKNDLER